MPAPGHDPFAGGEILRTVPSTEPQREIWLSVAVGGDQANIAYNESLSIHIAGRVDPQLLRQAIAALVARHDALRATFSGDGQQLLINANSAVELGIADLVSLDGAGREARRAALVEDHVKRPFDLRNGPLLRADLVLLSADRSVLLLTAHHLVCDGWSAGVLLTELPKLYASLASGMPAELAPAPSFADYAIHERQGQHGDAMSQAERYWVDALGRAPEALELPVDRPRKEAMLTMGDGIAVRDLAAAREDFAVGKSLVEALQQLARRQRVSLAAVLTTGVAAMLHRLTGQRRFALGMPWAGQADSGAHGLVGHCVNTLPVAIAIDPDAPTSQLLADVRRSLLACGEHQRLSFGGLLQKLDVARDPSRVPLIPVVFNLDQQLPPLDIGGAGMSCSTNARAAENFELFLNATPIDGDLVIEATYNTCLFERSTVLRWLEQLQVLLAGMVDAIDTPVWKLPLLTAAHRDFLMRTSHGVRSMHAERPGETTLDLIIEQVRMRPEATALVTDTSTTSYAELDRRATRLAERLAEVGVQAGERVGICLPRGAEMVVAILGIWKAGCAYVPLDPQYPKARIGFVVEDTGMSTAVTTLPLPEVLQGIDLHPLELDDSSPGSAALSDRIPDGAAIAYVLHTSGSTGKPKGVVVDHRALRNHVLGILETPGMDSDTVVAAVITLSFDLHAFELFGALAAGGRVVIASREQTMDGALLRDLIQRHGVGMLQATPSTFRLLLDADFRPPPGFTAVNGGEALTSDLVERLLPRVTRYWNGYGPTEATVHACMARIGSPTPPFPIGRPLPEYRAYVLDDHDQQVPIGVIGELHLGGPSVARGYLNRPELTAERFLPDPFADATGARMYRTGDYAYVGGDGQLYYVGRRDGQVKIRGFRIELGEVEAAIANFTGVSKAAATVHEFGPDDARLTGYFVAAPDVAVDPVALTEHLREQLPPQAVPQHLVAIERLTLTPNGKLDRKALPVPLQGDSGSDFVPPTSEIQIAMARIWAELLHVDRVGIRDGFFDTGGHSMLAARMMSRLRERFGVELPLRTIFQAQTIESLAAILEVSLLNAEGNGSDATREELLF